MNQTKANFCKTLTWYNVNYSVWNAQKFVEFLCIVDHLVKHFPRLVLKRWGQDKLLYLGNTIHDKNQIGVFQIGSKIKFLLDILPLCSVFLFTIQYLQICLHGHVRKILSILFNIITTVQIYGNYFFYFKLTSIFNSSDQNLVASIIDIPIFYLIFLYSVKASLQVFLLIFLLIILFSKILSIRDIFKWANFKPFQTGGPWRFPWCPFRATPLPVWNRWSSPGT